MLLSAPKHIHPIDFVFSYSDGPLHLVQDFRKVVGFQGMILYIDIIVLHFAHADQ